jgi:hypothetical protein
MSNILKSILGSGQAQAGLLGSQTSLLTPKEFQDVYSAVRQKEAQKLDLPECRDPQSGAITPYAKLAMRMGWLDGRPNSFESPIPKGIDFVQVAKCGEGYVVFLMVKGKPMMVEDGDLFPSDTLVTKLRMIGGE